MLQSAIMRNFLFKHLLSKIYRIYLSTNFQPKEFFLNDEKCLCLAPHADDESIGMGGVLAKYGKLFDVICLTDGAKGVDEDISYKEKIEVRKQELISAMGKINVGSVKFFDEIPDKKLILNFDFFKKIDISDYDYIFIPNILDQHRDHKAVALLLKELLKNKKQKKDLKIAFYEVWSPLALPNHYVDISDVVEQKKDLIKTYQSQLKSFDYLNKIIGLNSYRGLAPQRDYVEAFLIVDVKTFNKHCKIHGI